MTATDTTTPTRKSTSRRNGTATKTARRKATVARKAASPSQTPPVATPDKTASAPIAVDHDEHWRMIAVTAYHKAEQRGFVPGHELTDWLEAENEVRATVQGG